MANNLTQANVVKLLVHHGAGTAPQITRLLAGVTLDGNNGNAISDVKNALQHRTHFTHAELDRLLTPNL